jgi:hypothetical protein
MMMTREDPRRRPVVSADSTVRDQLTFKPLGTLGHLGKIRLAWRTGPRLLSAICCRNSSWWLAAMVLAFSGCMMTAPLAV